jgi:DNA modification methylase
VTVRILSGDSRSVLATLPSASVHCIVTSPPYYGLRDYGTAQWEGGDPRCDHKQGRDGAGRADGKVDDRGQRNRDGVGSMGGDCRKCGARRIDQQIGLEATPDAYVAELVAIFRECRRVLREDGTLWLNLGDSYSGTPVGRFNGSGLGAKAGDLSGHANGSIVNKLKASGLKPKDLIGIPWMVAFALRADGFYLRQDIIWCLSGGTRVYAKTQKGEMPMTIKDMVRLDPRTVKLWNGEKWTQVLGWNEAARPSRTYEIELRNGQRIGCTPGHLWPTVRGNIRADKIAVGDVIQTCTLPEPAIPKTPAALNDEMVGWFVGLYIAEGSRFDGTIQIASHTKENDRFAQLRAVAAAFDGTCAVHKCSDNGCTVAINGPILNGIIDAYVSGRIASDKHLHPRCWARSNTFLRAVLDGYLSGDGHWDAPNNRWRLGFCNNDELVADLRTIAARLGISVRLKRTLHVMAGEKFEGYRGQLRFTQREHHNSRNDGEVVAVRESRARKFWDIGVEDDPHMFALASGVLTHNSKPNPMPESVTDRCTKAHEYVFLLSKSPQYWYDADAIAEPVAETSITRVSQNDGHPVWNGNRSRSSSQSPQTLDINRMVRADGKRNRRSVWTIGSQPYAEAHFATMPPDLAELCIKAGTSERGVCPHCGTPWKRILADAVPTGGRGAGNGFKRDHRISVGGRGDETPWVPKARESLGWKPSCSCPAHEPIPATVLDPFGGAGTTGLVADRLGRNAILIELNPDYAAMARRRIEGDGGMFANVLESAQ